MKYLDAKTHQSPIGALCLRQGVDVGQARREQTRLDHDFNHRQIPSRNGLSDHKARFRNPRPPRLHMLLIPGLLDAHHRHLRHIRRRECPLVLESNQVSEPKSNRVLHPDIGHKFQWCILTGVTQS